MRTTSAPATAAAWLWISVTGSLVVALPGLLLTLGITDWWWLVGTSLAAAVASVFVKIGTDRLGYGRDGDDRDHRRADLLIVRGRMPRMREVTDPLLLGAHPAAPPSSTMVASERPDRVPRYVPRDIDSELAERLAGPIFVLLVGDSLSGKTRTAYEIVRRVHPRHRLVVPAGPHALDAAIDAVLGQRRSILWLGNLEAYLGPGGLTRTAVARMMMGEGHHRVVVGTIRASEITRHTLDIDLHEGDAMDRALVRDAREVLDQAVVLRLPRMLSDAERRRAEHVGMVDPRIADAVRHSDRYGLAEYLAAGPLLLEGWENAWAPGQNPRGAALVAAAVDCRRAGLTAPLPRTLLDELHSGYLDDRGGDALRPESLTQAWEWATRPQLSTAQLLVQQCSHGFDVFAYLADAPGPRHVPEPTLRAALAAASPSDALRVGTTAYRQHMFALAASALWRSRTALAAELGPEHPDTLRTREAQAVVAFERGDWAGAEAGHREVLRIRLRDNAPLDQETLRSHHNLAVALHGLGRYAEADQEHRTALDGRLAVLGPHHPDTLGSRGNLAVLMHRRGRLAEAERELYAVGSMITDGDKRGLAVRNNRANVLSELGQAKEAERLHRSVLAARRARLGSDDLTTLRSRHNLAAVLAGPERAPEIADELVSVLAHYSRLLGPEHPEYLTAWSNLSMVRAADGRVHEALSALDSVLAIRSRLLVADHPDILVTRHARADVLLVLGDVTQACDDHTAVLARRVAVLDDGHPDLGRSRHSRARALAASGELTECELEYRGAVVELTGSLGSEHPEVLMCRAGLAGLLTRTGRRIEGTMVGRGTAGYDHGVKALLTMPGARRTLSTVRCELGSHGPPNRR